MIGWLIALWYPFIGAHVAQWAGHRMQAQYRDFQAQTCDVVVAVLLGATWPVGWFFVLLSTDSTGSGCKWLRRWLFGNQDSN